MKTKSEFLSVYRTRIEERIGPLEELNPLTLDCMLILGNMVYELFDTYIQDMKTEETTSELQSEHGQVKCPGCNKTIDVAIVSLSTIE